MQCASHLGYYVGPDSAVMASKGSRFKVGEEIHLAGYVWIVTAKVKVLGCWRFTIEERRRASLPELKALSCKLCRPMAKLLDMMTKAGGGIHG